MEHGGSGGQPWSIEVLVASRGAWRFCWLAVEHGGSGG